MEDAATAEICRAQVWQWVEYRAVLSDGRPVSDVMVQQIIAEQISELRKTSARGWVLAVSSGFRAAREADDGERISPEFLTLMAYDYLD